MAASSAFHTSLIDAAELTPDGGGHDWSMTGQGTVSVLVGVAV